VWRLAVRTGAIDRPDAKPGSRHIHDTPTPRLGGLAILRVYGGDSRGGVRITYPGLGALTGALVWGADYCYRRRSRRLL